MICAMISTASMYEPIKKPLLNPIHRSPNLRMSPVRCFLKQNPNNSNTINPSQFKIVEKTRVNEEKKESSQLGQNSQDQQMGFLCGLGYWVQGFRCFPYLALNFHMAYNLNLHPSTLQLVQSTGVLPMAAKPLYGVLSDAISIAGAHRIPYISIGVFLQVLSWGSLALVPFVGESVPSLLTCVLLGNLGASITEVAKDALVAEYGQRNSMPGIQSYAFMAMAAGGILGNLLGGFLLLKTRLPKYMFFIFAGLLSIQFAISTATSERSLGLPTVSDNTPILESVKKQYTLLMEAVSDESVKRPLIWLVASISTVPLLSGSIFCYQTQCLNLDPWIIGTARVTGQLMLLSTTIFYDKFWKNVPLRRVIWVTQIVHAFSLLLDLVLVKQVNLTLGIRNDVFALCFSGVAETVAQFKLLPFQVLFARLAPPGCEGSLMSFLAAGLCLSSIFSAFLGVGLSSILGITSGDYSSLPLGIVIQFVAALLPLHWINQLPNEAPSLDLKDKKRFSSGSIRTRRYRRVGRVVFNDVYAYRRQRDSEIQR